MFPGGASMECWLKSNAAIAFLVWEPIAFGPIKLKWTENTSAQLQGLCVLHEWYWCLQQNVRLPNMKQLKTLYHHEMCLHASSRLLQFHGLWFFLSRDPSKGEEKTHEKPQPSGQVSHPFVRSLTLVVDLQRWCASKTIWGGNSRAPGWDKQKRLWWSYMFVCFFLIWTLLYNLPCIIGNCGDKSCYTVRSTALQSIFTHQWNSSRVSQLDMFCWVGSWCVWGRTKFGLVTSCWSTPVCV